MIVNSRRNRHFSIYKEFVFFCESWWILNMWKAKCLFRFSKILLKTNHYEKYRGLRTASFWVAKQRVVAISYRRFGTNYRSHIQGSRIHLLQIFLSRNTPLHTDTGHNCPVHPTTCYTRLTDTTLPTPFPK
jgi:hypothetical protein